MSYLIFVISFTQARFLNRKFLHPKTGQNNLKLQQISPKMVKYAVLRVQSGKFYTRQNSFTQAGFFNPKFLHPKTAQNTQKLQQIPPKSVKHAVLRVQSGKFYTGHNFFTRAPPVVPATNMRYGEYVCEGSICKVCLECLLIYINMIMKIIATGV